MAQSYLENFPRKIMLRLFKAIWLATHKVFYQLECLKQGKHCFTQEILFAELGTGNKMV